jgi:hypothetical protein
MSRTLQPALALYVIGPLGLGVLALVYHDFALDWQPVPPWVPDRTLLAYGPACSCSVVAQDCCSAPPHCGQLASCSRTW